jgi:hypothetical protein
MENTRRDLIKISLLARGWAFINDDIMPESESCSGEFAVRFSSDLSYLLGECLGFRISV